MGNNAAFTSFEATVLAAYNRDVLDKDLLLKFMEPYRGTDIDTGGMQGTLSKDGLDVVEIVLKIFGVELPPRPDLPKDYNVWTPEQDQTSEAWYDKYWEAFFKITDEVGWK